MIKPLFAILLLLIFLSCKKSNIEEKQKTRYLTNDFWIMKSYIDYNENKAFEISKAKYKFNKDGTYIIYPEADSLPRTSTWYFDENCKYLIIGSNKFKLQSLTKKLLGLNYGTVRIYYVKEQ